MRISDWSSDVCSSDLLPKFTSETLLIEVPELLEGTYRTQKGIGTFSITSSNPDRFLGKDGIRFTYEYVDADNLPLQGEARATLIKGLLRSEERRVGKECASTCRSRWSPYNKKKKKKNNEKKK